MSIESYISQLEFFGDNLNKIVAKVGVKSERLLVGYVQKRLFDTGLDANERPIGQYKTETKINKIFKRQPADHITLKDTSDWYNAMFVGSDSDELFISSKNWKTSVLESNYGSAILGLTETETDYFIQIRVNPALQRILNDLPDIEI